MAKKALIVYGGWDGHTPKESAEVFKPVLEAEGYDVTMSQSLDTYADLSLMSTMDLVVPIWTMSEVDLTGDQWYGLCKTIEEGCGLAGFHGGIIDSFRNNVDYQWMTGGQWVQHPGNCIPQYRVDILDPLHDITKGIKAFTLKDTEQYYCHIDPGVNVLCSTTFVANENVDEPMMSKYPVGVAMPYAWTRPWGKGKVFVAAWGHTFKDFDVPEAKEIVKRGMLYVSR